MSTTHQQVLSALGLSAAEEDGRSAEEELRAMVDDDLRAFRQAQAQATGQTKEEGMLGERLRSFLTLELDWRAWATCHPGMLSLLVNLFHPYVPPHIKELAAQVLVRSSAIPVILTKAEPPRLPQAQSVMVEAAREGLVLLSPRVGAEEEEEEQEEEAAGGGGLFFTRATRRQVWLLLLVDLMESGVRVNASLAHELLATLLVLVDCLVLRLAESSSSPLLDSEQLELLVDLLAGLNYHHRRELGDAVVVGCAQRTVLMETFLHRLNAFGFPNHEGAPQVVTWEINLIMDILEDPINADRALYTNDFRVLCDIALRELQSFHLSQALALDYLGLASSLVAAPAWKGYRKADFDGLLENLSVETTTLMAAARPAHSTPGEVDRTIAAVQVLAESIREALLASGP